MLNYFKILLIAMSFYISGGCNSAAHVADPSTLKQGIIGIVVEVSGNQMPSPDTKPVPPPRIETDLYIYELTGPGDVISPTPGFYSAINTKLVLKLRSGKDGAFAAWLNPGSYSIFTKPDSLFYANISDMHGNIAPFHVKKGEITELKVKMDHNAVY
ncbi:MAG TPA: hypothetical protein VIK74_11120 [Parasegetibacter sp.]